MWTVYIPPAMVVKGRMPHIRTMSHMTRKDEHVSLLCFLLSHGFLESRQRETEEQKEQKERERESEREKKKRKTKRERAFGKKNETERI